MKLKKSKKYFRSSKKVLNSKLDDRNLRRRGGVNTSALSILRYSIIFISWRKIDKIDGLEASSILETKKGRLQKWEGNVLGRLRK